MFARRNEPDLNGNPGLQDRLSDSLRELGAQIVLYGDTGVGKSSLLRWAADDEGMDMVVVECTSAMDYEKIIETAIGKLVDFEEFKRVRSTSAEVEAEAGIGVKILLSLKGRLKGGVGENREFTVTAKAPLDTLIEAMSKTGKKIIALDNFQNIVAERDRLLVAQMMEFLSDRARETDGIMCVVVGIADDAASLLGASGSFRRRAPEIGVPRMPDDEVQEILERGFGLLGLTIEPSALASMIFYSDGFPYFAHLLGLNAARAARRQKVNEIDQVMLTAVLARAAEEVDASFEGAIRLAFEVGGEVQPRRRILSIVSRSDERKWLSGEVIAAYGEAFEKKKDVSFLHTALAQLADEKHGRILKRTGGRTKYVYQFRDPRMRPYLRITAFPEKLSSGAPDGGQ